LAPPTRGLRAGVASSRWAITSHAEFDGIEQVLFVERSNDVSPRFADCAAGRCAPSLAIQWAAVYNGFLLGAAKRGGLAPWQGRRAAEMIRENLDRNIHLSDMARECGLSVSHFTRAFRKSFGMSPYRWLLERRIDRSKALLAASDLPIADIALRSGFSDQAALTRAFGRIVGESPGRWRRAVSSRA